MLLLNRYLIDFSIVVIKNSSYVHTFKEIICYIFDTIARVKNNYPCLHDGRNTDHVAGIDQFKHNLGMKTRFFHVAVKMMKSVKMVTGHGGLVCACMRSSVSCFRRSNKCASRLIKVGSG